MRLPAIAAVVVDKIGWRTTLSAAAPFFLLTALGLWLTVPGPSRRSNRKQTSIGANLRAFDSAVGIGPTMIALTALTLMLFVFQGATTFLTTYLVEVKGTSQGFAGLVLGAVFLVGVGAQWIGGGLADRIGAPLVMTIVSGISTVPLLLLPTVDGLPALALVGAFIGVRRSIVPILNAYIIEMLPHG